MTTLWQNDLLASCPWGPVTANGVDLLTKIYVVCMEAHTSHPIFMPKMEPIGPTAAAGGGRTDGRKARKYI